MDFERLERPNADLPKGEKRVVQEGQKRPQIALGGSFSRKWCGKPEGTGCLCRARSSGRNHRGGHERSTSRHSTTRATARTSATTRATAHNHGQSHNRFRTQNILMAPEGPVATPTPQASLEVKAVRQEGTDAVGKEVEKTAQTPAVSAAPVSEGRLPNTGTEESVASLVAGLSSSRSCRCCAG